MDPRIAQAEATLARIRARFYADGLSDFDMLLRVRESARVRPSEIGLLAVLFYLMVLSTDSEWAPWVYAGLVIMTFVEHRYYLSQRRELDSTLSLFLEHSPKTLEEIKKEK